MSTVFLGIGTNLGNRKEYLEQAIAAIEKIIGPVLKSSSVYETEPWGFRSEDKFLNMVVAAETGMSPQELLAVILRIEMMLGRVRQETQYSSRTIDIDILLYDDVIIKTINLTIPHPLIRNRKFVLVPLCEIAADKIHPVLKKSFADLLEICDDKSSIRIYS